MAVIEREQLTPAAATPYFGQGVGGEYPEMLGPVASLSIADVSVAGLFFRRFSPARRASAF